MQLQIIKNPFQPDKGRETKEWKYKNIGELRKEFVYKVSIQVDDRRVPDDYEPNPATDKIITVKPAVEGGGGGSSKVFGIVAAIGLAIATGGAFATAAGVWTGASYIAASAVFLGSVLVSRNTMARPDVGKYAAEYNTDPTYSWSGVETMEGQNNAVTITYGKVKSGGQTIGKRVDYAENKETLNWLVSAGEGELEITDVKLNDTPIGNYTGAVLELRPGTNDQSVIEFFDDTTSTKSLAYEVMEDYYRTEQLAGNGTEGIVVALECNQGLYYANDKGGLDTAWVDVKMEYKLRDEEEWHPFSQDTQTQRISGAQQTAIRRQFSTGRLQAGEYDVRMIVTGRSHARTSNRACTRVWWSMVSTIVYDDFTYPNIALLGIKAVATDQLSGTPTLSFIKERKNVWVYDPDAEEYVEKPANNPAWAAYDLLHQCRRLKNINTGEYEFEARGVAAYGIMYDHFKEWADFCDEKNLKINIEITSAGELLDVVNNHIANIGRGRVIRFGTRYGATWDRVQQPVQMFGMGNIGKGSFSEEFTPLNDRANCVEVTYNDAERDYERQMIMIFGSNYDQESTEKPAQLTLNGCTSYEQAFREGKYQMFCNERLVRTCTFRAGIDSINSTVGDVITVSHDVPQWAYSGRIANVDGTTVLLPCEVANTGKKYIFAFICGRLDKRYEVPVDIVKVENGWTTVRITEPAEVNPEKYEVFDLALVEKGFKPFRIRSISRADDMERIINCIEYDESIYNEEYDIPRIQYSMGKVDIEDVTNVTAKQIAFTDASGLKQSKLFVSWERAVSGGKYEVSYSSDGTNYKLLGTTADTTISDIVRPFTTYYVKVTTVKSLLRSRGVIIYPVIPGEDVLPPNVTELNCEMLSDGTRRYYWDFEYPDPNDIAGFRIKYSQGGLPNWDKAVDVQKGLITTQPFEAKTVRQGSHIVMIKAVDNAGNESAQAAVCIVDFGDLLEENVLYKLDHHANNWKTVIGGKPYWKGPNNAHWKSPRNAYWKSIKNGYVDEYGWLRPVGLAGYWKDPDNAHWKSPESAYWKRSFLPMEAEFKFEALAGGYWWLSYDMEGAATIWYKINTDQIYKQYSTRVRIHAGDIVHIKLTTEAEGAIIKTLTSIIDVPDREEHFTDVEISTAGAQLNIQTPNYYTTAVRIDSLPLKNNTAVYPDIVSRNPCIIRLVSADGSAVSAKATLTWQGFEKEVIEDE